MKNKIIGIIIYGNNPVHSKTIKLRNDANMQINKTIEIIIF